MITHKNSGFKILVVDDDPDLLLITERLLHEQHYTVSSAVNGQECLQTIHLDKPDLLLLDVMLPDMSGIDICKTIKSDPQLSSTYVLLLSGMKIQSENISEGLETGADGYLIKPVQKREFLARVDTAARTIRAEKRLRESEEKYRLLADNMTDAVWLMDMDLKFVYISPSVEKIRGYTLAELRQFSLDQILTPASFQKIMETISVDIPKILADPTYSPVQIFELDFYTRDGSIHSLEAKMSVIRDENGNPVNILGQDREITRRRHAEQALQERLNELNCLYSISALMELPDLSLDEILNKTLMVLSQSMKFPETTEVRIVLEGKTYQSAHFRETTRMLTREIKVHGKPVGQLEVCYLEERPSEVERPFLIEQQHLLNAIARRLGHMIEHKKADIEHIFTFVRNEALLDAIPDMMFIFDSKGVIVDFHTANHEDLYVQPETFLGKNVADVLPCEATVVFLEKIAAVFLTGQSCQSTYMLEMNGEPKHYESRFVPCGNGQVLSIVRDITDRKRMEEELQKSEERFRHISSTISDISYSCVSNQDGSYSIDWMAGAAEQITGYSIDEIKAIHCWRKLVIDEDFDKFNQHVIGLTPGSSSNCELRLRHKNGAIFWVASFAQCIKKQEQPEDMKLYGALVDITERKRAENKLRESEERFSQVVEQSQEVVWEVDANGLYTYVSPMAQAVYGYLPEQMICKIHFYDIHPEAEREKFKKATFDVFHRKESFYKLVNKIVKPNGTTRVVTTTGIPILDENGNLTGYRGTDADITERKQAEQELIAAKERAEESDRLKTAFMNNISHEIRTPLNGILGFSQLMADPDLTEDERAHFYSIVKSSSNRLLNTVTDFMDMSLIASGNQGVQKKLFAPGDLLDEIYNRFVQPSKAKKLSLTIQTPPITSKLRINSDQELLRKVLSHLVDNALKFTNQGTVSFGFKVKRNELEFFVKDTGVGINKKVQPTIFDKFMQENVSDTRGHEGSGMGLPIAKGFVELLGGRIWFESSKGSGSSFFFTLPIEMAADVTSVNQKTVLDSTAKPLILIAEDEPSGSLLLERILHREGIDILVVNDGQKAVAACRQNPLISLVLMDIQMPVMDGFDATKQIKSFSPHLPVIAITAYALSGDENKALEAGCDDYIAKPFEIELLLGKLKKYGLLV